MIATNALITAMLEKIAADTATLAPAALELRAHLIAESFAPSALTTLAGLAPATFDGYAPLDLDLGPPLVVTDPETGRREILMQDPAGGYVWICTGATGLPQEIFGVVLTDSTGAATYGSEVFPAPITVTGADQVIVIGSLRFLLALTPFE